MRAYLSRSALLSALLPAFLAVGCGGEPADDADAGDTGEAAAIDDAMATDMATESPAGRSARVRLVNLWVDGGDGAPVDVRIRPIMGAERAVVDDLGFGEVTDAFDVHEDAQLYVYAAGEIDTASTPRSVRPVATEGSPDIEPGVPLTIVLTYAPPIGQSVRGGGMTVFRDEGEYVSGSMPARDVEGAMLVAFVAPAKTVLGDALDGLKFGTPGQGCLRPAGGGANTSMGGTATVNYDVTPGPLQVAAYEMNSSSCSEQPLAGPVEIDIPQGERGYLLAYGTSRDELRLKFVPAAND
jgi:hypothetical protein